MGRIKTTLVKRSAENFLDKHPDLFKTSFKENKVKLAGVGEIKSKKLRNKIAGYLTRLTKQQEKA
ncbi:MAG: 30S ribosomal protein S17e [Nanoarchaeota archaeon]|nr:30S ribosomal protein S17e [Nanoarchaeota archaeon]|tara:strand:+ start:398 stop:592 length:195 start_codon:yes stop_codon:yes gene_type:complete